MCEGARLWEFHLIHPEPRHMGVGVLVVVGVGYLLVGYLVFHLCQRRARRLGVLGDY